jgi:hypothetical protein
MLAGRNAWGVFLPWLLALLVAMVLPVATSAEVTTVPATACPWLAAMPNGSIIYAGDSAPAESPAQVTGLSLVPGQSLSFSITGTVSHANSNHSIYPFYGPEGGPDLDGHWYIVSFLGGATNGIGQITTPIDSLLGVFLDDNQPSLFSPPAALDFSTAAERDFLTLAPALRQPFFIGDGLTPEGVTQQFTVPTGATRLYLATMDVYNWSDNAGSFSATVTQVPEPTSGIIIASIAGLLLLGRTVRRR